MASAQDRSAVSRRFAKYTNDLNAAFKVLSDSGVAGANEAIKLLPATHTTLQQSVVRELKETLDNFLFRGPGFLFSTQAIATTVARSIWNKTLEIISRNKHRIENTH